MNKVITLLFVLLLVRINAQVTYNNTYTFTTVFNSTQSHTYKACKRINLKPGFSYVPSASSFSTSLQVDPSSNCSVDYSPVNLYNPALPLPNLVNTSDKPGKINYNYSVDNNGSFLINIPIICSPGTQNMSPNLSLVYNSASNEGMVGMGWNLSGLSRITRNGSNYFYNGQTSQIGFNLNDAFYLDGQILYPLSGINGGNNTLYGTEAENYTEMRSFGNPNFFYFHVKTKDGTLMEYGTTSDSRVTVSTGAPLVWLLKRVTDRNGNFWEITYKDFGNSEVLPEFISYTGNSAQSLQPYNKVKFYYNQKPNISFGFVSGFKTKNTQLLSQIVVEAENQYVRSYEMVYSQASDTKDNLLNEVIEWNELSEKYNTFKCFYNSNFPSGANAGVHSSVFEGDNAEKYFADVNGDGFSDIISTTYNQTSNNLLLRLFLNNGQAGFPSANTVAFITLPLNTEPASKSWSRNNNLIFSDFNKDGMEDFALVIRPTVSSSLFGSVIPFISNGTTFVQQNTTQISFPFTFDYTIGDFDGDGVVEYAFVNSNNIEIKKYDATTQSFLSYYSFGISSSSPANVQNLSAVQLTNDQKQELFFTTSSQSYYVNFNTVMTGNLISITSHALSTKTYPNSGYNCYLGDYNGDGYTDVITQQTVAVTPAPNQTLPVPNDWTIAYSKGNSTYDFEITNITSGLHSFSDKDAFTVPSNSTTVTFNNNNYSTYFITDVNADGTSEFVQSRFSMIIETNTASSNYGNILSITNPTVEVFDLKNITNAANPDMISQIYVDINTGGHVFISPTADFDGDGHPDAFMDRFTIFTNPSNNVLKRFFKFPIPSKQVNLVGDGLGKTTKINYNTLPIMASLPGPAFNPLEFNNGPSNHPDVINLTPRLNVVHSISEDQASFVDQVTTYNYEATKFHLKGKGFLGFSAIYTYNDITKVRTTSVNTDPTTNAFFVRLPRAYAVQVEVSPSTFQTVSTQSFVNVFDNQFLYGNFQNRRYSVYTASATSIDNLNGNVKTVQSMVRDNYGNPTQQKVSAYNSSNALVEEVTTNNTFTTDCMFDPTIPVRMASTNQVYSRTGKPNHVRNSSITYASTSPCLPVSSYDVEKNLVTTISYNAFGNVTQTTFSGSTIGSNYSTRQMVYDAKGRFLIESTNALAHKIQFTVEPKYGNILVQKDANNLVSSNTFDGFGVLRSSTDPIGITASLTTEWSNNSPNNTVIYTTASAPGKGSSFVYFDKLGREVYKRKEANSNLIRSFKTNYNTKGQVSSEDDENFSLTTTYLYDPFGRPSLVSMPTGASTQYSYAALTKTITVTQGSITQVHVEQMDAAGKLIQKTDQNGVIDYEYGSHGQPDKIALGNQTITMSYDNLGRQAQLNDAAAGPMQYTYDELDRLLTQTNAKNQAVTNTYDVLGRITQKAITEGVITYQYDAAPNGKGKLNKTVNFNGQECTYQYDQFSRISTKTEKNILSSIDSYSFQYGYDQLGRLNSETYPNGVTLTYSYNALGYPQTTNYGSNALFTAQDINLRDQLSKGSFGNGFDISKTYQNIGLLTSTSYTHSNSALNTAQSYNIQSASGNLSGRTIQYNSPYALTAIEQFNYDNSHRLTTASVVSGPTMAMQYDSYGNITDKTGIGQMNYSSPHPNAISSVNTATDVFPSTQQDITYTSFEQPLSISEGSYSATFEYSDDMKRKVMRIQLNSQPYKEFVYLGNYEKLSIGTNTYELVYVGGYEGLVGVLVSQNNGVPQMYYLQTDHLGSIVQVNDNSGQLVYRTNFDAWGRERDPATYSYTNVTAGKPDWLIRGLTGHEHIDEFGLINMNGRLYDPLIGRMLSPDNYVQNVTGVDGFNRYSYVYNNPFRYTDPSGNVIVLAPILAGVATGAVVGALTAAAIYATTAVITKQEWDWKAFGRATAIGAIGGAIGGGLGAFGAQLGAFGQSLGYNVLSNVAGNSATQLAFGEQITAGGFVGMVAGGFIGAGIGGYSGVSGGALKNIGAELAFGIGKGAITGALGGATGAALDGGDLMNAFIQGAKYGAIAGGTSAGLTILSLGPAYKPSRSYGDFGRSSHVYRRGTFLTRALAGGGSGITIGRNLVTHELDETKKYKDNFDPVKYNHFLRAHETGHFQQQTQMGFGYFYTKTLYQYLFNPGFSTVYQTPGTLEYGADQYAKSVLGYGY